MNLISIDENTILPLWQKAVAEALGKIGDARAIEPLFQALKDEDEGV